jgi:uncharacterized protein
LHYEGTEPSDILDIEQDPKIRSCSDIAYALDVQRAADELIVKGSLAVTMELECARCADFFSTRITDSAFLRAYELAGNVEMVDVTPDIREDMLLHVPPFPLCDPACKGLCPQCGANLNRTACSCKAPVFDDPWNVLDDLDT